jgi:hypothetical protein
MGENFWMDSHINVKKNTTETRTTREKCEKIVTHPPQEKNIRYTVMKENPILV